MIISVEICQTNKNFSVTVQRKNACKLEFVDHWWLQFLDQPQSEIVVFSIINFQILKILVTIFKLGIVPNDIIILNEQL